MTVGDVIDELEWRASIYGRDTLCGCVHKRPILDGNGTEDVVCEASGFSVAFPDEKRFVCIDFYEPAQE